MIVMAMYVHIDVERLWAAVICWALGIERIDQTYQTKSIELESERIASHFKGRLIKILVSLQLINVNINTRRSIYVSKAQQAS